MGPEPARQTMYLIFTEYADFGSEFRQLFFNVEQKNPIDYLSKIKI